MGLRYKAGLVATHGPGKTTQMYAVSAELKKRGLTVRVIGELSTLARERGIPIDQRTTREAQAWILHRQCAAELEASIYDYDVALCDRTVFDNYCYLQRAGGEDEFYRQFVLGHHQQHPYNKLFYLPLVEETDGQKRDPNPAFQREIDTLINLFFEQYPDLPLVRLSPKREEWTRTIVNHIFTDLGRPTEELME